MAGLQIKTRNREITLQEEAVRKFKESLRGELIGIGDAGYDDARSIWNAMIDRRPALIASCLGVADVVTCVNFAREHGITFPLVPDPQRQLARPYRQADQERHQHRHRRLLSRAGDGLSGAQAL